MKGLKESWLGTGTGMKGLKESWLVTGTGVKGLKESWAGYWHWDYGRVTALRSRFCLCSVTFPGEVTKNI